jgi:LysM domain
MIPWKRTLRWALCWAVACSAVSAEEPAADAAMPDDVEMAEPAVPAADEPIADPSVQDPTGEDLAAPADQAADLDAQAPPAMPADMDAEPASEMATAPAEPAQPDLGAVGYDSNGRQGRIHVVVKGDTLWDISSAYLGTPWVWPSIWKDNGDIPNPHLIYPGDRIWITPGEMRRISAEEADRMMANVPAAPAEEPVPAAMEDASPGLEAVAPTPAGHSVRISGHEMTGLISPEAYRSAASVVGRNVDRMLMSQEDGVYIGLGEGEVKVGDEFTLFRTNQKVLDPDTGAVLGYHVDFLGWVKVEQTFPETSLASIRMSTGEVEVGDRVMPREPLPSEIEVKATPENVEGKITFFPGRRVLLGYADFVYLNRGSLDGLQVGSPLEVYRPGYLAPEVARDELVEVPDHVVASMLVVRAEEQTAVAMVTSTTTELELGDRFRGAREP